MAYSHFFNEGNFDPSDPKDVEEQEKLIAITDNVLRNFSDNFEHLKQTMGIMLAGLDVGIDNFAYVTQRSHTVYKREFFEEGFNAGNMNLKEKYQAMLLKIDELEKAGENYLEELKRFRGL